MFSVDYLIQVNVALALFYGIYRWMFAKDTFFHTRRFLLWSFWLVAISFPFWNEWLWIQEPAQVMRNVLPVDDWVTLPNVLVVADHPAATHGRFSWWMLYGLVTSLFFLRFFFRIGSLVCLYIRTDRQVVGDMTICRLKSPGGPFSFFRWIFVYPPSHSESEWREILIHEQTHAHQCHSLDILFAECMTCLLWFNPFVWLLRKEIRDNLEYLADDSVLHAGCDRKCYQYHLLGLSTSRQAAAHLYSNFNVSSLKNRIRMMNKQPSKRIEQVKLLVLLPLMALLLTFSNCNTPSAKKAAGNEPVKVAAVVVDDLGPIAGAAVLIVGTKTGTVSDLEGNFALEAPEDAVLSFSFPGYLTKEIAMADMKDGMKIRLEIDPDGMKADGAQSQPGAGKADDDVVEGQIFTVVEEQPSFPGGPTELFKYVMNEVKYPKIAQDNGIQGRVVTSFVVDKEGNIKQVKVERGVDPALDAEALRVVKAMPKWIPGKQKGKAVAVRYILPVQFRLQ